MSDFFSLYSHEFVRIASMGARSPAGTSQEATGKFS